MEFRESYSFDDILLVPRYSDLNSRSEADVSVNNYSMPVIMSPMDTVTTREMIDLFIELNLLPTVHRYFKNVDDQYNFVFPQTDLIFNVQRFNKVFFSVGSIFKYKEWIDKLIERGVPNFLVDMAHGDSKACVKTVEYLRKKSSVKNIMAGNIATKSGFERLQGAGANYIRCGIGSGSICETRNNTGFGVPQFTTILDCVSRKDDGVYLIADGGIKNNGDIAKAIAAGADFVMLGKMLAATDLAGGESFDKNYDISNSPNLIKYKAYHGMASKKARGNVLSEASIEGVSGLIRYTGKTRELLKNIKLNLQASMSYCGTRDWRSFKKNVKIIKISESSIVENATHLSTYN